MQPDPIHRCSSNTAPAGGVRLDQAGIEAGPVRDFSKVLARLKRRSIEIERAVAEGRTPAEPLLARSNKALVLNVTEMRARGVFRLPPGNEPYGIHPIQAALIVGELVEKTDLNFEPSLTYTLIHDQLEEGGGVNAKTVKKLYDDFSECSDAVIAAVVLTEPAFSYKSIMESSGLSRAHLQEVAYLVQLAGYLRATGDAAAANAVLADKLANASEFDYVTSNSKLTLEEKKNKIASSLGFYRAVLASVRSLGHRVLTAQLETTIRDVAAEHGIEESRIFEKQSRLEQSRNDWEPAINAKLGPYFQKLGLLELNLDGPRKSGLFRKWVEELAKLPIHP